MILRKGAISALVGEKVLIPINMRDGSILAVGKGNSDWNYSAPHGAGRRMSRKMAKKMLSVDDYKRTMENVFTTCVCDSTLDEAPMAYKSMEEIIVNIKDTVDVLEILKPIYNFKSLK
jgi:RNA-splicing ligase RtcB